MNCAGSDDDAVRRSLGGIDRFGGRLGGVAGSDILSVQLEALGYFAIAALLKSFTLVALTISMTCWSAGHWLASVTLACRRSSRRCLSSLIRVPVLVMAGFASGWPVIGQWVYS